VLAREEEKTLCGVPEQPLLCPVFVLLCGDVCGLCVCVCVWMHSPPQNDHVFSVCVCLFVQLTDVFPRLNTFGSKLEMELGVFKDKLERNKSLQTLCRRLHANMTTSKKHWLTEAVFFHGIPIQNKDGGRVSAVASSTSASASASASSAAAAAVVPAKAAAESVAGSAAGGSAR
jgi:hypothetical protein